MTLPSEATTWFATVWADRDYHNLVRSRPSPERTVGDDADFPSAYVAWEVPMGTDEVRVGRRGSDGAPYGTEVPEIDLFGPPRDPGVSHLHAVLLALPGGRWVVLDAGSTNGTTLNYAEDALPPDTPQPLRPGDRIHLGAWTTITVDRR